MGSSGIDGGSSGIGSGSSTGGGVVTVADTGPGTDTGTGTDTGGEPKWPQACADVYDPAIVPTFELTFSDGDWQGLQSDCEQGLQNYRPVEFTYGAERVKSVVEEQLKGKIDFVAQNVQTNDFGDPVFSPYTIRTMNGVPVAIIGQAFPYTPIANPRYFVPDWTFGIQEERLQAMVDEVTALMYDVHPRGNVVMLQSMAEADLRDVLPRIEVPTLLLYGEVDSRSPVAIGDALHAQIPGSKLTVLEGVGHLSNIEAADRFNREVRRFLRPR